MNVSRFFLAILVMLIIVLTLVMPSAVKFVRDVIEAERVGSVVTEVETQLGFDNYFPSEGESNYDPAGALFATIEPGGYFDQAGFRAGDRIPQSHYDFFGQILLHQGEEIAIPIIRNGENLTIQVDIPVLELSHDPCSFRVFECGKKR